MARVGISVICAFCGKQKTPRGRIAIWEHYPGWCYQGFHGRCPGYDQDPQADDLWPGEDDTVINAPEG